MRTDGNLGGTLTYNPTSAGLWDNQPDFAEPSLPLEGSAAHWAFRGDDDHWERSGGLFRQMNNESPSRGGHFVNVPYFNGGLFAVVDPIELTGFERDLLTDAASEDWAKVKPPIFGSLFEGSMDAEVVRMHIDAGLHPILPLLIDFNAARESVPDAVLPASPRYPGGAERAGGGHEGPGRSGAVAGARGVPATTRPRRAPGGGDWQPWA